MRQSFWAEAAREFLESRGRQDLIDKGDALAERVAALILSSMNRLQQYCNEGDLYNGKGGSSGLENPDALIKLDDFVNVRLRQEIDVLEHLLEVFDDLNERHKQEENTIVFDKPDSNNIDLPDWY